MNSPVIQVCLSHFKMQLFYMDYEEQSAYFNVYIYLSLSLVLSRWWFLPLCAIKALSSVSVLFPCRSTEHSLPFVQFVILIEQCLTYWILILFPVYKRVVTLLLVIEYYKNLLYWPIIIFFDKPKVWFGNVPFFPSVFPLLLLQGKFAIYWCSLYIIYSLIILFPMSPICKFHNAV